VVLDQQIAEAFPRKDVEMIVSVLLHLHEDDDEASHWNGLGRPNDLALVPELDLAVTADVTELPRRTAAGLDLDRNVLADFVRRNDVVVRNVPSERRGD